MVREGVSRALARLVAILFCCTIVIGTGTAAVPAWADDPTPPPASEDIDVGGAARNGTWIALGGAGVLAVLAGVIVLLARPGADPDVDDDDDEDDQEQAPAVEPEPLPVRTEDESPFARPKVEPLTAARVFHDDPVPEVVDAVVAAPEPDPTPEPDATPQAAAAEPRRRFLPGAPFVAKEHEPPVRPARALIPDDVDDHEFDHPDDPEHLDDQDVDDSDDWRHNHGGRRAVSPGHDPYRHLFRSGEGHGPDHGEPMAADAPRPRRALD